MVEDKFVTVKEELEEMIEDVKNDVDEKSIEINNNKRLQEQSFDQINIAMTKLRKDLKQLGIQISIYLALLFIFPFIPRNAFKDLETAGKYS